MTKREKSEWRNWWNFCGRRIRECLFLAAWAAMIWALDAYVVNPFPVGGLPKYMLFTFEGLFAVSTVLELIFLLYWPYKAQTARFFNKRRS